MKYELTYIVSSEFSDPEVDTLREEIAGLVTAAGATITRNETLAKIKLAYPIKTAKHGTYVLVHFDAESTIIGDLDRKLHLHDSLLRHLIIQMPKGAEKKEYQLTSYVAPLSEEERETRRERPGATAALPSPTPAAIEPSLNIEELDKKLDALIGDDLKKEV